MSGNEFRKLRKSVDLSQAKLSKEMDVTVRSITRWETGEVEIPKIAVLALKLIVREAKEKGGR